MKFGKDVVVPDYTPFPKGQYPGKIVNATATTSKSSGSSMISIEVEIYNDAGETRKVYDNLITDGSNKGAHFAMQKFRAMGVPDSILMSDEDTPDEVIAQNILGLSVLVTVNVEPMMEENPLTGKFDKVRTFVDPATGNEQPSFRNVVKGYRLPSGPVVEVQTPSIQAPVQAQAVQAAAVVQRPEFQPQAAPPIPPGSLPWAQATPPAGKNAKAAAAKK